MIGRDFSLCYLSARNNKSLAGHMPGSSYFSNFSPPTTTAPLEQFEWPFTCVVRVCVCVRAAERSLAGRRSVQPLLAAMRVLQASLEAARMIITLVPTMAAYLACCSLFAVSELTWEAPS